MPETDGMKLGKALGSGDGSALEGIELGSLDGLLEGCSCYYDVDEKSTLVLNSIGAG